MGALVGDAGEEMKGEAVGGAGGKLEGAAHLLYIPCVKET